MVVDTYGAWDPASFRYFKSVATSHAVVIGYHPDFSLHLLMTALSVSLRISPRPQFIQSSHAINLLAARAPPSSIY